jgi:hypothetical protein
MTSGNLGVIDYIVLILLIVGALVGFIRGFGKNTVRNLAFDSGLALGYFVGIPLSRNLVNIGSLYDHPLFKGYVSLIPESSTFQVSLKGLDAIDQSADMAAGLTEMHFPKFFQGIFISQAILLTSTVGDALASSFTFLTLSAICFVVLFLVTYLVLRIILGKLNDLLFGEDGRNVLGRIAGAIRGMVDVGFAALVLLALLVLVDQLMVRNGNTALHALLESDLKLSDGSYFSIGRLFYNTASSLLAWISL